MKRFTLLSGDEFQSVETNVGEEIRKCFRQAVFVVMQDPH